MTSAIWAIVMHCYALALGLRQWILGAIIASIGQPPAPRVPSVFHGIKVVCVSDTHNTFFDLPDGDVLLHAGDLSQSGHRDEVQAQLDWINSMPHQYKVVIAGNHDHVLDCGYTSTHRRGPQYWGDRSTLNWGSIIYLDGESATLDFPAHRRTLTIYGSPLTPRFGGWPFQYPRKEDVWRETVPEKTDVLLVHGPPKTYLDDGKGCPYLLREIWRAQPRLVVFGHIHEGRGKATLLYDTSTWIRDKQVWGADPGAGDIVKLIVRQVARVLGRAPEVQEATLVNAAAMGQRGRPNPPDECYWVVYL